MKNNTKYIINQNITCKKLLVIDENGNNLGEMSRNDALNLAASKSLDLVLILSNSNQVNTAKILDFGKFQYVQKKKLKDSKKKQVVIKNKEIKIKPTIADHDLNVRIDNVKKWLGLGYRIRFVVLAYGRIGTKKDLIYGIYNKFIQGLDGWCKIQKPLTELAHSQYESFLVPINSKNKV